MTASAATGTHGYGALKLMGMAFTGLGLFGCFLGNARRRSLSMLLGGVAALLITGTLLATTGCGSSNNGQMNQGTASIVVTAQSGALTHMTTINLTVQ
jgi:hypothetical protein